MWMDILKEKVCNVENKLTVTGGEGAGGGIEELHWNSNKKFNEK